MHESTRFLGRPGFLGLGALLAGGLFWTLGAAIPGPGVAALAAQDEEVEIIEEEPAPAAVGSPWDVRPLLVGAEIPDLVLANAAGEDVDLRAACAEQARIFVFYRGGW